MKVVDQIASRASMLTWITTQFRAMTSRCSPRLVLVLVSVAFVALSAVGGQVWRGEAFDGKADAVWAAARDRGYPTTPDELDAWYAPVPASENAAVLYAFAAARMVEEEPFEDVWPPPDQPLTPAQRRRAEQRLDRQAEALALLHRAAMLPRARYAVDLSQLESSGACPSRRMTIAAQLLQAEAVLAAESGRGDDAVDALLSLMAMARSLRSQPTIEAFAHRGWLARQVYDVIGRVLSRSRPSDAKLALLADALHGACDRQPAVRAIAGNRVIAYHRHRANARGRQRDLLETLVTAVAGPAMARQATDRILTGHTAYLRIIEHVPSEGWLEAASRCEAQLGGCHALLHGALAHITRMRLASAAVAIERYRRAHGLPRTLDDLPGATPVSPIEGKVFGYERRAGGFAIWCDRAAEQSTSDPRSVTVATSEPGR